MEKVVGIRWENGRPFNIKTETEEGYERGYDVDYSEKENRYFFHNSGDTGESHKNYTDFTGGIETLKDFVDTFRASKGRVVFCKKCESHIDGDNLCKHLEWDDEHSIVVNEDGDEIGR